MLYPLFISIWFIHLGAFHRSVVKSEKTAICLSLELGNLKRLAVALNKISNVIWTKFRLKCNLETRIYKHVYHIKITLQDHTRLQKERIMRITKMQVKLFDKSGNIWYPEISGVQKYPEISGIRKYPVSKNIRYPEILGIQKYPVSGNIRYSEISSIWKYQKSGKI